MKKKNLKQKYEKVKYWHKTVVASDMGVYTFVSKSESIDFDFKRIITQFITDNFTN